MNEPTGDGNDPILLAGTCPPYIQQGMRLIAPPPESDAVWTVGMIYEVDAYGEEMTVADIKSREESPMTVACSVLRTWALARDFDPNKGHR